MIQFFEEKSKQKLQVSKQVTHVAEVKEVKTRTNTKDDKDEDSKIYPKDDRKSNIIIMNNTVQNINLFLKNKNKDEGKILSKMKESKPRSSRIVYILERKIYK